MALGPCDAFIYAFERHRHQRESAGSVVDNKNGRIRPLLLLMCTMRFHPEEPPPIRNICLFAQKRRFSSAALPLDFHSLCGPRLPWLGCFRGRRHSTLKWRNQRWTEKFLLRSIHCKFLARSLNRRPLAAGVTTNSLFVRQVLMCQSAPWLAVFHTSQCIMRSVQKSWNSHWCSTVLDLITCALPQHSVTECARDLPLRFLLSFFSSK